MAADQKASLDYTNGKIPLLFRKIFFPTLMGMIFTALITILDGIIAAIPVSAFATFLIILAGAMYLRRIRLSRE